MLMDGFVGPCRSFGFDNCHLMADRVLIWYSLQPFL